MGRLTKKEAHDILGVPSDAPETAVRKAYLQLARQHHPDKCNDPDKIPEYETKFKQISAAFQRLTDDADSSDDEDIYEDDYSHQGGGDGMDFFSFFSFMSGGGSPFNGSSNPFDEYFEYDGDDDYVNFRRNRGRSQNYPRESVGSEEYSRRTEEEQSRWREESQRNKEAARQQRMRRKIRKQQRKANHLAQKTMTPEEIAV